MPQLASWPIKGPIGTAPVCLLVVLSTSATTASSCAKRRNELASALNTRDLSAHPRAHVCCVSPVSLACLPRVNERKVPIDCFSDSGLKPLGSSIGTDSDVSDKIEFRGVEFRYPTRLQVAVLQSFNLTIEAGKTLAFCGPSGGGKSTIVALLERFYDPVRGQVLLDGVDLKELNLRWLRAQIGLVGQEPTLFIGSIADNIAYGLDTKPSQEKIEAAAKVVNARDSIAQFPNGYAIQMGMKGEQLSDGQKQCIAIARVILKNPAILALNEATSALDSESEQIV